jgi:hypothetical protein
MADQKQQKVAGNGGNAVLRKAYYSLSFSVFLFLFFVWAAWEASGFSDLARFFPYYIAIAAVILSFIHVVSSIAALVKEKKAAQTAQPADGHQLSDQVQPSDAAQLSDTVYLPDTVKPSNAAPPAEDEEEEGPVLRYMIWIIGYIALIYLIGFQSATTLFLLLFLYFVANFGVLRTIFSVVVVHAVIYVFSSVINLYWPEGIFPLWPF